ncbi:hypothetical protein EST38_g9295 [Candolleomyces aberdarensis]|uniref:CCHC-type domain-containing protein n=1 Tax=Candolleomyces aberdarensis TaxID=2316362 RepID=A0A4Q2DAC0_9AGAR|nr:hypothetical protein EST38_g9295 [Candolleomyces aberdarensis]
MGGGLPGEPSGKTKTKDSHNGKPNDQEGKYHSHVNKGSKPFQKKTNGCTDYNSNQAKFKNFNKVEKVHKNQKEFSKKEREQLKAEGRCYHCREQGHMARACPKVNSVNDKGTHSMAMNNVEVELRFGNVERFRELAETTEATHSLELGMMGWAPAHPTKIFNDDEPDVVFSKATCRATGLINGQDWDTRSQWDRCLTNIKVKYQSMRDPLLKKLEQMLHAEAPYAGDWPDGVQRRDQFVVYKTKEGYQIYNDHYVKIIDGLHILWDELRQPDFDVEGWYQKEVDNALGEPSKRKDFRLPKH